MLMRPYCGNFSASASGVRNFFRYPANDIASKGLRMRKVILKERLRARLDQLGISARKASIDAGLSTDAIRNILDGSGKSPRYETLVAIAGVLETSVPYLVGMSDVADPPGGGAGDERGLREAYYLSVRHEVAAGRWLATDEWLDEPGREIYELGRRDEYSSAQWLERVVGPSMNRLIPDGALVHVVDPIGMLYEPKQDDIVVVERTRAQGAFRERSLKQVNFRDDGQPELLGRSFDERYNAPLSFDTDIPEEADDVVVQVVGLVIQAYIFFKPPPLLDKRFSPDPRTAMDSE